MKKNLLFFVIIFFLLNLMDSCKKGEEDPFFSLRSRKARIIGDWVVSSSEDKSNTYISFNQGTEERIFETGIDNGKMVFFVSSSRDEVFSQENSSQSGTADAEVEISFKKDGTFVRSSKHKNRNSTGQTVFTSNSVSTLFTFSINENLDEESSGTWNFLGNVESNYRDKERIILHILENKITDSGTFTYVYGGTQNSGIINNSATEKFANGEKNEIWHITSLRNKEIKIYGEINHEEKYLTSTSDSTCTKVESLNMTLESK